MIKHPAFFVFILFYTSSYFGLLWAVPPALATYLIYRLSIFHPDVLKGQIWD
jgi:hypothetical protein